MFVDCDDKLDENWFENVLKNLHKDKDIIYFVNNCDTNNCEKEYLLKNLLKIYNNFTFFSIPCSKVFNREFILNNNIKFDEKIINGEDMLFNIEALLKTNNYYIVNKNIYVYRINYSSVTKRFNEKFFESDKSFQIRLKDIFEENNIADYEEYCNFCLENAVVSFCNKLALMPQVQEYENYIKIFDEQPYKLFLEGYNEKMKPINIRKIILFLIKKRKYKLAIFISKVKFKIKKILILKQEKYKFVRV